ncbi:dihydroorotase [Daejeonella rubra]|uniref:Dihydroorotase n=1 Tax=Daejeonella rubra TaxID=990371 RepID=A0A1G9YQU3_9SPHI|nr:amidohydrolase/deacetylase family metallohydrolase [Daejeonella rubra]SDN10861.1 dihydroorotase [Daejeonella rubra]
MNHFKQTGRSVLFAICLSVSAQFVAAQEIDILLKGGHVIDAKNKISSKMDVALSKGKILKVAPNIPVTDAKKVVDVSGMYVSPGLIDIHTHVFTGPNPGFGHGSSSVKPDDFTFRAGITTVVDAGTSGYKTFPLFKEQIIDRSRTRVLAFLNAFAPGMVGTAAEQEDMKALEIEKADETIKKYPDLIAGVKIGHYSGKDWKPFDAAASLAHANNRPLFVECHITEFSLEDQLNHMKAGDIITHAYENVSERMPVVDENGKVRPFVLDARKKGILFDVGHGGVGFWFNQAVPSVKQGLAPDTFGTDMHHNSVNSGMKDMLNLMSKYLNMGMQTEDIIQRASWGAATAIKRPDLGNLSPGSEADIAVIKVLDGKFGFLDAAGFKLEGTKKFQAEMTIRAGKIVWDLNGMAGLPWSKDLK